MDEYLEIKCVQKEACGLLQNLAAHEDNQLQLAVAGATRAILAGMGAHPDDPGLQGEGCGALGNIAANDKSQAEVASVAGMEAILETMRKHRDVAGVQEKACGFLGNYAAGNAQNQLLVARAGGIDLVLDAMKLHRKSARVQQNATNVLQILAANFVLVMKKAQWVCDLLPSRSVESVEDTPDPKRQRLNGPTGSPEVCDALES